MSAYNLPLASDASTYKNEKSGQSQDSNEYWTAKIQESQLNSKSSDESKDCSISIDLN